VCVVRDLDLSVGTGRGEVGRGNIADLYVACQGFLTTDVDCRGQQRNDTTAAACRSIAQTDCTVIAFVVVIDG
jgi:hypothetical protein